MRRSVAALGIAGAFMLPAALAFAASDETVIVGTSAEASYQTSSLCAVPVACGSGPTTTSYPADTLHVAEQAGTESARAYLAFAYRPSPGTSVASVLVRLPVADDAGSNAADTALIQACLVPSTLTNPAPATPPDVDCSASSRATYLPGTPASFEVDVTPFLLRHGGQLDGLTLALLPVTEQAGAAVPPSWHVAFSGKDRKAPGAVPITAEVGLRVAAVGEPLPPPPAPPAFTVPPPAGAVLSAPAPAVVAAPVLPQVAPAQPVITAQITPVRRAFTVKGGQYGVVWALPLVLLVIGWAITATATRDLRSFVQPPSLL